MSDEACFGLVDDRVHDVGRRVDIDVARAPVVGARHAVRIDELQNAHMQVRMDPLIDIARVFRVDRQAVPRETCRPPPSRVPARRDEAKALPD